MEIILKFSSWKELEEFRREQEEPKVAAEVPVKKAEEPKAEKKEEAKKPAPKKEAPAKTEPAIDKVAVRGVLFKLNKKTGVNRSRGLIESLGYERLDDVKQEDLPKLYEKAKEALDA